MTIKQQGGVFGRNPTFNDVTIEGQLTFDGDIDINSDLKVDGDLEVTGTSTLDGTLSAASAKFPYGTFPALAGADNLVVGSTSGNNGMTIISNNTTGTGFINFADNNSNDAGQIKYRHDLTSMEIVVERQLRGTFNANGLAFPSGNGIDFSATAGTGTSEVLDDYEEGAFSPTLENVTITYDSQSGTYTKIGRDVFCYGFINVATIDNADPSSVAIGGLPFTPSGVACSLSLSNGQGSTPLFGSKLTDTTGGIVVSGNILPSNVASQYVQAYNVANVIANTGGSFYFALHYTT